MANSESNTLPLTQALAMCRVLLMPKGRVGTEDLERAVDDTLAMPAGIIAEPKPSRNTLLRHLQATYSVYSDDYSVLSDASYRSWLPDRKAEIPWHFWNRYRQHLEQHVRLAPDTINHLDNLTDDILDHLIDPKTEGQWDRRGMVVGQVQSGKTGNYIGLINKAADAGFRVIVILAGIHDSLRAQTQIRVDHGFVGQDTQTGIGLILDHPRVGVGLISPRPSAHPLTSSSLKGDFSSQTAGTDLGTDRPVVMVVKKNGHILRNLVRWMGGRGDRLPDGRRLVRNAPLLVIDDEADNASINVSKDHVSRINGLVRALLSLFEKRAYVGYTATPFANIFIPVLEEEDYHGLNLELGETEFSVGQDLFPKDFIINIPPPSNYIGPARVFGLPAIASADEDVAPLGVARIADDYVSLIPDRHRRDADLPTELPESLHRAVKCFFLACAARAARGQERVHNSMLVHVSRFIRWQDHVATLLDDAVKTYQRRIEMGDRAMLEELEQLWHTEFEPVTHNFLAAPASAGYLDPAIRAMSWEELRERLHPAVAKVRVRAVHGDGRGDSFFHDITPLDYYAEETRGNHLSIIAVGGDKLSRGLTLEGLCEIGYLRASRMYDTLMQMGRWFGYRPGYADLCRLFTSTELQEWYRHITLASEELRREFDFMVALHRTPKEYGLKIRSHPGVLKITAANKFRYAKEMELSYSNTLAESYKLSLSADDLMHNRHAVDRLLGRLDRVSAPERLREAGHLYFGGPDAYIAVQVFLRSFRVAKEVVDGDKMADYIAAQAERGALTDWTVVLLNRQGEGPSATFMIDGGAEEVGVFRRDRDDAPNREPEVYWIKKNHIISPEHEALDLNQAEVDTALDYTRKARAERRRERGLEVEGGRSVRLPSGEMIRLVRDARRGLLLLYPLVQGKVEEDVVEPVMGYAVSFPVIEGDVKVRYAVNQQFQRQRFDYHDEAEEVLENA